MNFINTLQSYPHLALAIIGLLGLLVGSFLNVVIIRIPQMLLEKDVEAQQNTSFNLLLPPSHCPTCKNSLRWFHNIPLLSYIFLRGKCGFCHHKISFQYPLVELLSSALSILVADRFGLTSTMLLALLFTWSLIALSVIDYKHMLLPDDITLPFLWLGLLVNAYGTFAEPAVAIRGAIFGYLALWVIYWAFKLLTQKDGLGYGDFKLLAMLGAWLGWQSLPLIIFISSFLGSVFGLSIMMLKNRKKDLPIPFGPFIAFAGFIVLLKGFDLSQWYYQLLVP